MEEDSQGKTLRQLHAIVRGRVQGVNFRHYARQQALQIRVKGWVRNLEDGTVETVAVGSKEALEKFLVWLRQGPSSAHVIDVEVDWSDTPEHFTSFEIRHGSAD